MATTVKFPDETAAEFNQLKIKLAGSIGWIPTNAQVVDGLIAVGNAHLNDLANTLIRMRDS